MATQTESAGAVLKGALDFPTYKFEAGVIEGLRLSMVAMDEAREELFDRAPDPQEQNQPSTQELYEA